MGVVHVDNLICRSKFPEFVTNVLMVPRI
jgi:hypothetical protein